MKTRRSPGFLAALVAALSLVCTSATAACPAVVITSGLGPTAGVTLTNQGNVLVSESTIGGNNNGRISIVAPSGVRRTLLSGLPSGIADVGDPAGPSGLFMRGRTLYVAISVGDVAVSGGIPGTALPNPNPVSSPLFSSVLAVHFSAAVEKNTQGFTLALAHHQTLASGATITLTNAAGEKMTIERVVDFVNYTSNPIPLPTGIRVSNPFDLVVIDDFLYVTDGGQNNVRKVDLSTGAQSVLVTFPNIANPLFGTVGGPFSEAVPTGIRAVDGMLLVTLFRGAPFAPGTSNVVAVNPATGSWGSLIAGLKTAIDVVSMPVRLGTHAYLVLQHASAGPFFGSPGQLLGFDAAGGSKTVIADCLTRPTSMALDEQTGVLYLSQLGGSILAIPIAP